MTQKNKKILFFSIVLAFIIITPIIILYSIGLRIDFKNKRIVQPGLIFVKTSPKNAQIYINEKNIKKTDFLFGSAEINNLLPNRYKVKIAKEGFQVWEKNLEVKEGLATEVKDIILFPEILSLNVFSKNIENFFIPPSNKSKIILQEKEINEIKEKNTDLNNWTLKIFDLNTNIKTPFISKENISKKDIELTNLFFSPDSKKILMETKEKVLTKKTTDKETFLTKYYIIETEKTPAFAVLVNYLNQNTTNIVFNPNDYQKILFLEDGKLKEIDLVKNLQPKILLENIISFTINNNNIYYLDSSGFTFKTDFSFSNTEKINDSNISLNKEAKYNIYVFNSFIFLKENDVLYLLNNEKKDFEKYFEPVKNIIVSYDYKKLLLFNDSEIWIIYLEDKNDQPYKKKGDKVFITRLSQKIENASWISSSYIIFNSENEIKIAETDDRDKINIFDISKNDKDIKYNNPKVIFNNFDKKLYILNEKTLYQSQKIIQ